MPGGDRTGPLGMGPRTGRAAGFCVGSRRPGYAGFGRGRGGGAGFGGRGGFRFRPANRPGRGRGLGFNDYDYVPETEAEAAFADEREMLLSQVDELKAALTDVNERLDKLQAAQKEG